MSGPKTSHEHAFCDSTTLLSGQLTFYNLTSLLRPSALKPHIVFTGVWLLLKVVRLTV